MVFCQGFSMRTELPNRRAPVTGSANEIERAIAQMLAAGRREGAVRRTKADVTIGEIRGMIARRPLACAPGDAAGDILLDSAAP